MLSTINLAKVFNVQNLSEVLPAEKSISEFVEISAEFCGHSFHVGLCDHSLYVYTEWSFWVYAGRSC